MRVLALKVLREFWERHPEAEKPLRAWYKLVVSSAWKNPSEVREVFNSADFIGDSRVVFDIGGNKYRIVARVVYGPHYRVMIKFVGTHKEYDRIDAETV